jgi:hypothetical protein
LLQLAAKALNASIETSNTVLIGFPFSIGFRLQIPFRFPDTLDVLLALPGALLFSGIPGRHNGRMLAFLAGDIATPSHSQKSR